MDVVQADPKYWTRDPFVPVEENGYIFGRGSEDTKFDIAMMVATMAQLKRDGFKPKRSIILLLSGDEETSMTTTRALRSEEHTSELQSLMRISYVVFCLNKNRHTLYKPHTSHNQSIDKDQT